MHINRRDFLKTAAMGVLGAALGLNAGCAGISRYTESLSAALGISEGELEIDLFNDFISPKEMKRVTKEEIEPNLMEIVSPIDVLGKTFHIGDGYCLTADHVIYPYDHVMYADHIVFNEDEMRINPQGDPYIFDREMGFKVLKRNPRNDVTLIRIDGYERSGKALFSIAENIHPVGDRLSFFTRLDREMKEHYVREYDGVGFFDEKKEMEKLGRLILYEDSLLYERQGKVLEYGVEELKKVSGDIGVNEGNECFSSLLAYAGNSGSPIFYRLGDNKYVLAGILSSTVYTKHKIAMPDHPLGKFFDYESLQTGGIFINRGPIVQLIKNYLTETLGLYFLPEDVVQHPAELRVLPGE